MDKKVMAGQGSYFNHLNASLNFIDGRYLYEFNLITKKIVKHKNINIFFGLKDNTIQNLQTILVYFDKILIFHNNNKIVEIDENKEPRFLVIDDIFSGLPDNIECAYINFLDIQKGIPIGMPTFIKHGKIYIYDLKNKKVKGPRILKDGIINNVNITNIFKSDLNLRVNKSGYYRAYLFGAGHDNGGFGGFIYNDIFINKSDTLNAICGTQGSRIPAKGKYSTNSLSNNYSIQLPFNSSCAGSGGTFLFIKDKLEIAAGGGGGWSSEIVKSPYFCNSKKYNNTNVIPEIPIPCIPIKKIIIKTQKSQKYRYRLSINKLHFKNVSYDDITINIKEYPPHDKNNLIENKSNGYNNDIYTTDFSSPNTEAIIEINISEPISDYLIELDYTINSTGDEEYINSSVIFIDEQYRKHRIDNFNYVFGYKYISPKTLFKFLNKEENTFKPEVKSDGNKLCKTPGDLVNSLSLELINKNNSHRMIPSSNLIIKGGLGGGGSCVVEKNENKLICGGGGGYIGGKSNSTISSDIDYVGGSGGSSFINKNNIENGYYEYLDRLYINNFNNTNGYMVLHFIGKQTDLPSIDKLKKSKKKYIKGKIEHIDSASNSYKFFDRNVEMFVDKHKLEYPQLRDNQKKYDFSVNTFVGSYSNKNIVIPIDMSKDSLSLLYILESDSPFDCFQIGWDDTHFIRTIFTDKDVLKDNISTFNHGFSKINKRKMERYLLFQLENNIYKHLNYISYKDLQTHSNITTIKGIQTISELTHMQYMSEKQNNNNMFTNVISGKQIKFSNLYLLLRINSRKKQNYNIKLTRCTFNPNKISTQSIIDDVTLHN